jgi:hypothetical protein
LEIAKTKLKQKKSNDIKFITKLSIFFVWRSSQGIHGVEQSHSV